MRGSDGRVDAHDILVKQHHALPPILLDVVFQFHTILTVVIDCGETIVDITAGENETILLAVAHDFLEYIFLCHFSFNSITNWLHGKYLRPVKLHSFFHCFPHAEPYISNSQQTLTFIKANDLPCFNLSTCQTSVQKRVHNLLRCKDNEKPLKPKGKRRLFLLRTGIYHELLWKCHQFSTPVR